MAQIIELQHGPFRLSLRPDLGGCIAGFWLGDVPVLRSTPAADLANVRQSASYPLAPFSNRIGNARFEWRGAAYELAQNFLPEPHAIHGVAWQRPWQVTDSGANFAVLTYQHQPDAAWPFAFDCVQSVRLGQNGLTMQLSITNRHSQAVPIGGGWHPYFVKRPGSHISFAATHRWDMDADKLPTERLPSPGLITACTKLDVDHCFSGWQGSVQLRDELLTIDLASNLRHLVVFTQPERDFVAIEPVSHVNNAINLPQDPSSLGLVTLAPGQTWSAHMTIDAKRIE